MFRYGIRMFENRALERRGHKCCSLWNKSCDALTVFMLGVRHAGERHEDAISLFQTVSLPKDVLTAKSRQLSRVLGIKNAAEYEGGLMNENDAREAVRDAGPFFSWVKEYLSK